MPDTGRNQSETVYCASERAIVAAAAAYHLRGGTPTPAALSDALIAAHHPDLGSDRSVCLRDVIEALEHGYHAQAPTAVHPADYITKRFLGDGHEGLVIEDAT